MVKVYYNKDGFLCDRYPLYFECEDESTQFVELSEEDFIESLGVPPHFAWKIKNDKLELFQYEEIPEDEIIKELREKRESVCFPIINRGELWYRTLTAQQIEELNQWYLDWLNVTDTKIIPEKPKWLK